MFPCACRVFGELPLLSHLDLDAVPCAQRRGRAPHPLPHLRSLRSLRVVAARSGTEALDTLANSSTLPPNNLLAVDMSCREWPNPPVLCSVKRAGSGWLAAIARSNIAATFIVTSPQDAATLQACLAGYTQPLRLLLHRSIQPQQLAGIIAAPAKLSSLSLESPPLTAERQYAEEVGDMWRQEPYLEPGMLPPFELPPFLRLTDQHIAALAPLLTKLETLALDCGDVTGAGMQCLFRHASRLAALELHGFERLADTAFWALHRACASLSVLKLDTDSVGGGPVAATVAGLLPLVASIDVGNMPRIRVAASLDAVGGLMLDLENEVERLGLPVTFWRFPESDPLPVTGICHRDDPVEMGDEWITM
jgi:hypothetical protein